jgi:hypothetical protein
MTEGELVVLTRAALLSEPDSQISIHTSPTHEDGKWRDSERVEVEQPVSIRAE